MDPIILIVGIVLLAAFFLVFLFLGRSSSHSALLAEVTGRTFDADSAGPGKRWLNAERLAIPLGKVRSLLPGGPNPQLVRRLVLAGYRKPFHADTFMAARLLMPVIAGLVVAFWVQDNVILWFALAVISAFFLPEFWLTRAINKRRERINLSLPDALDLLAICMEAGLGLDQAIVRIGQELSVSHPELSEEFLQVNLEQRAGQPRIGAWRNLADRIDVESIRSFVNMLVQTERFGTPISRSLGTFSEALRTQRRQRAEELAAKTTIKLVLPLVFFIFPSIFIVTVVPAVISVMKGFGVLFGISH
jgi:tight adherence protein C